MFLLADRGLGDSPTSTCVTELIQSYLANTRVGPATRGDFVLPRGDLLLHQILEYGGHTRPEIELLVSTVRAGDTILDVGAHVGTFAIPLARAAGPDGLVCAFEPVRWSYDLLLLNIELNGLGGVIRPVERAVSDQVADFSVETPNQRNTGGSYLVASEEGIQSVVLDDWVSRHFPDRSIDLLKIDVEGMEPLVLAGAKSLIASHQPCVYFEISPDNYSRYGASASDAFDTLEGYRFFINVGERNAASDAFELAEIGDISDVTVSHFDLLAVPDVRSDRIPQ